MKYMNGYTIFLITFCIGCPCLLYTMMPMNEQSHQPSGHKTLTITVADAEYGSRQSLLRYPQRLWYDEENQLMYIACAASSSILIYDVSKQWNLTQIHAYQDTKDIGGAHDIKVINNWSYDGVEYGNVALVLGANSHFSTLRCNLSTSIELLDTYAIGQWGAYLDYFINDSGHLIVFTTRMTSPGVLNTFDCSNPCDIVNLSQIQTVNNKPWTVFVYGHGNHLVVSFYGDENQTPAIYDIAMVSNPMYVAPVYSLGPYWHQLFPCFSAQNEHLVYAIRKHATKPIKAELVAYDISDPHTWMVLNTLNLTDVTGEWQLGYTMGEWAAVRHYDEKKHESHLVDFYNIKDPYDMYYAGSIMNSLYFEDPHMQWLDMKHNRAFILDYSCYSFVALNVTVNNP